MAEDDPLDHECETGVAPTELGGAIVETGPQLAYSAEMEALDYPEPASRVRVGLIAASIVAVAGLVVGAVLFVGRGRHESATAVAAPSSTPTTGAAPLQLGASAPPAPLPVTITTVIVQSTAAPKSVASKASRPPPKAARVMSTWTYDIQWRGTAGIAVIEYGGGTSRHRYITNGVNPGMGTGWTGDLIGVDPVITPDIESASCTLYVDGQVAKTSSAVQGDGHDVECVVRLAP
jgi:hypothetical protein